MMLHGSAPLIGRPNLLPLLDLSGLQDTLREEEVRWCRLIVARRRQEKVRAVWDTDWHLSSTLPPVYCLVLSLSCLDLVTSSLCVQRCAEAEVRRLQAELQAAQDQALAQRQQAPGLGGGLGGGAGGTNKRRADGQPGRGAPAAKRGPGQGGSNWAAAAAAAAAGEAVRAPATPTAPAAQGRRGPMRGAGSGHPIGGNESSGSRRQGGSRASSALQLHIRKLKKELKVAQLLLARVRNQAAA